MTPPTQSLSPYKRLMRLVYGLLVLAVACFCALVGWVVTGPRSINVVTPYIEAALVTNGSNYRVHIENSLLIWDGWEHPVGIMLENVYMLDNNGASIAHFPEVGVRMDGLQLVMGKIELKSIELIRPVAKLTQDQTGKPVSFGFSSDTASANAPITVALDMLTSDADENPLSHLKSFIIRHAALSVIDNKNNAFLSSPDTSIVITRGHGLANGTLTMPLQFDGKHSEIDIKFTLNGKNKTVTSNVTFNAVPLAILHALAPTQQWMNGIGVPLSGHAELASDFDANIDSIRFDIDAGAGTIDFPDQFEHPLTPKHITLQGALTDGLTTYNITQGQIDFGNHHTISFNGIGHKQGNDYGVDGNAETVNIPVDEIRNYWPLKLAPHTRTWVVNHISKGSITKATAVLHFKPGEFALKDTPEAAIDATIVVKGSSIHYKPTHPPITELDGTLKFTGKTMDAAVTHARYMDATQITSARVRFPDFYPDDVRLFIDMNLETTAKDVKRLLSLPEIDKAKKLGLTDDIAGEAKGNAKLDFIAFSENDKDDIGATGQMNYDIKATLSDAVQNHFMGQHDVAGANIKLGIDNKGIKVAGSARIDSLPMDIDLSNIFAHNETNYTITTDMPVGRLPDFGLPKLDFAKGNLGINATFISSAKTEKADATIDLSRASIELPQHGFAKKMGEKAILKINTEQLSSGDTLIKSFAYKGENSNIAGIAQYDKTINDFSHFSLNPLRFGKTDLDSLTYEKTGNTLQIIASGRAFDISPYLTNTSNQSNYNYSVDIHAGTLLMGQGHPLSDINIKADCPADGCRTAHITAKLKDGSPFTYIIAGGKLTSTCSNAGELARVFGIFDTIEGGNMTLTGQYTGGKLEGELEVKSYTLKNAPVLTKMFTIASLSGILDTLSGKGIYFDRLIAPFAYHRGSLVLKDVKAHGSALGLTAGGIVDMNKSTLDLNGVIVPSYTINSLIGNVPLIGNILMGGSGKGLVALSYNIKGDIKDPSISINPLTALTPGFLRDIFNIFDKPAPDMDAIMAEQKKAKSTTPDTPTTPNTTLPATPPATSTLPLTDQLQK